MDHTACCPNYQKHLDLMRDELKVKAFKAYCKCIDTICDIIKQHPDNLLDHNNERDNHIRYVISRLKIKETQRKKLLESYDMLVK